jgi:hypothetical protein
MEFGPNTVTSAEAVEPENFLEEILVSFPVESAVAREKDFGLPTSRRL